MACNIEKTLDQRLKPNQEHPIQLLHAVEHLKSGNILIYPTETLYGMGVDASNSEAIKKLFALKKRSLSKPVPVLIPNRRILNKYCKTISKTAELLMEKFWPGPLTIILKSDAFPEGVSNDGKVGFRISSHPFAQAILSYFGEAITATSANVSDKPSPTDPNEFFKIFPKDSFMLIQDGEKTKPSQPSTVVDCSGESYKIIREGSISEEKIKKVLEK